MQKFTFKVGADGKVEKKYQEIEMPVESMHEPPLQQKTQAISLKSLYAHKHGQITNKKM